MEENRGKYDMNPAEWTPDLSVGSAQMDRQHRELIAIIARYHDAMSADAPRSKLIEIFENVIDYAREHFHDEENLMAQRDYPALDQHRDSHTRLVARVTELLFELRANDRGAAQRIDDFLFGWLARHICEVDRQYRPYMLARAA